jgi:hypothetical protein
VCINAAVDTLFCDERLEVPVGSWELVHIDVFERLMDKLGPRLLSSVLFQTHLLFATPYNATLMNTPGMPCVFANPRSHSKSYTRPECASKYETEWVRFVALTFTETAVCDFLFPRPCVYPADRPFRLSPGV